eukprot:6939516-Alexandrium_andersonii.AAC.1
MRRAVAQKLGAQTVLESPPSYEPQPNGSVENAVRQLKGLVRTLMLALQAVSYTHLRAHETSAHL